MRDLPPSIDSLEKARQAVRVWAGKPDRMARLGELAMLLGRCETDQHLAFLVEALAEALKGAAKPPAAAEPALETPPHSTDTVLELEMPAGMKPAALPAPAGRPEKEARPELEFTPLDAIPVVRPAPEPAGPPPAGPPKMPALEFHDLDAAPPKPKPAKPPEDKPTVILDEGVPLAPGKVEAAPPALERPLPGEPGEPIPLEVEPAREEPAKEEPAKEEKEEPIRFEEPVVFQEAPPERPPREPSPAEEPETKFIEMDAAPTRAMPEPETKVTKGPAPREGPFTTIDRSPPSAPAFVELAPEPTPEPTPVIPQLPPIDARAVPSEVEAAVLLDVMRVQQCRLLLKAIQEKAELWELFVLVTDGGERVRAELRRLVALQGAGDFEACDMGSRALFDRLGGIRQQHGSLVRNLRAYLAGVGARPAGAETVELAVGFMASSPRGRDAAVRWLTDPDRRRAEAAARWEGLLAMTSKYQQALSTLWKVPAMPDPHRAVAAPPAPAPAAPSAPAPVVREPEPPPPRPAPPVIEPLPLLDPEAMPEGVEKEILELVMRAERLRLGLDFAGLRSEAWERMALLSLEPPARDGVDRLAGRDAQALEAGARELGGMLEKTRARLGRTMAEVQSFVAGLPRGGAPREAVETALGLLVVSPRGREEAAKWIAAPSSHLAEAGTRWTALLGLAERYQRAAASPPVPVARRAPRETPFTKIVKGEAPAVPSAAVPPPPLAPAPETLPVIDPKALPPGVDPEVLADVLRVQQCRKIFESTHQEIEVWEVFTLVMVEGDKSRTEIERLLALRAGGKTEEFSEGALALFEQLLSLRAKYGKFIRDLRGYVADLEVGRFGKETLEMALGFLAVSGRGRDAAQRWMADPKRFRAEASGRWEALISTTMRYQTAIAQVWKK